MNPCFEVIAGVYLQLRSRMIAEPVEEEVFTAQDSLETCRTKMEKKEIELQAEHVALTKKAYELKRKGDLAGAKARIKERRFVQERLTRIRSSLDMLHTQINAIKMSELDKEMVQTMRQSADVMKRAGVAGAIQDAESIISELDGHMQQIHDMSAVLSTPLQDGTTDEELMASLDEELSTLDEDLALLPAPIVVAPFVQSTQRNIERPPVFVISDDPVEAMG